MIAVPQTPWQRLAPRHRPLLLIALALISVSGFVAGLAIRPVVLNWGKQSFTTGTGTTAPTSASPQATAAPANPATTPALFSAIMCAPIATHPGGAFTLSAYAAVGSLGNHPPCQLAATAKPASGVRISLTFPASSGIPAPIPQTTGADGLATWKVPVPATTHPGSYDVTLHATWGKFGANWVVLATVAP